jgi:hypothetical protein
MTPKTIVILDEAFDDLESGKVFYQVHGDWLANHFINSLLYWGRSNTQRFLIGFSSIVLTECSFFLN